jgi:hypothetical protein
MKYNPVAAALNHVTELIEESVGSEIWRRPKKDPVYPSGWVGTWIGHLLVINKRAI